jgi:hypothetical protein
MAGSLSDLQFLSEEIAALRERLSDMAECPQIAYLTRQMLAHFELMLDLLMQREGVVVGEMPWYRDWKAATRS